MQANTHAQRNALHGFHVDWKHLGSSWKEKGLARERLAEIALLASTASVLGYIVWWAAKAAESYTILGLV